MRRGLAGPYSCYNREVEAFALTTFLSALGP